MNLRLFALLLVSFGQLAADFPEYRGPNGNGIIAAKNLPTKWNATSNVAWKQDIPGKGWSSPVLVNGRLYLTTAVPAQGKDLSLRALCVAATDGKIVWDIEVFKQDGKTAPPIHSKNSHASPTPLIAGERLYVHFGHQGTACLDLNGRIVWTSRELPYIPQHGNGGTPILVDGLLVYSVDSRDKDKRYIVALEADTGKLRWKTDRSQPCKKSFSFATPTLITVAGKQQIISPSSDAVYAYDPKTGDEIWHVKYNGYSVIPKPVYADGLLYVSTCYDSSTLMAIDPKGTGDLTAKNVKWVVKKNAPHTPSVIVHDGLLYMVSDGGIASCLDAKTGVVIWSERLGGGFSASPILADGKLYFENETGTTFVLKPGRKFEQLAKNKLGEQTLASFAAADGALFIRTVDAIYRVGTK